MPHQTTAVRLGDSWRVSVDRAWRSETVRRKFEDECGFAPLAEAEHERHRQALSGDVQRYRESFVLWATKYLGLGEQAPLEIRRKIYSEREA
jgi:hypothetical protein